jgi:hypothetical protein
MSAFTPTGHRFKRILDILGIIEVVTGILLIIISVVGVGDFDVGYVDVGGIGGVVVGIGLGVGGVVSGSIYFLFLSSSVRAPRAGAVNRKEGRRGLAWVRRPSSVYGWRVGLTAAFIFGSTRERWLDDIAEALYDVEDVDRAVLLWDFLAHAPRVIARSWVVDLPRLLLSGTRPGGRR